MINDLCSYHRDGQAETAPCETTTIVKWGSIAASPTYNLPHQVPRTVPMQFSLQIDVRDPVGECTRRRGAVPTYESVLSAFVYL